MRVLKFVLVILLLTKSYGQDDFNTLLEQFGTFRSEIPMDLATKFFNYKPDKRFGKLLTDRIVIKTNEFVALSTHLDCYAGGRCQSSTLTTFDFSGKLIDQIDFESEMSDCDFLTSRKSLYESYNLIIIKTHDIDTDCVSEIENKKEHVYLDFIEVSEKGDLRESEHRTIDLRRENHIYSHKIFSEKELIKRTKSELSIIRNEIFASYGYMFKTKKWQEYFKNKSWYKSINDDVTDKISPIEKSNMKLIVKLEKK